MPPVRKSTGQAVSPLRRPSIAGVRELRFRPPAIATFPLSPGLNLMAEDAPPALEAHLSRLQVWSLNLGRLDPPELSPLQATMRGLELVEPWSMSLSVDLMGGGTRPSAAAGSPSPGTAWLGNLTPLLLAPALESDVAAALGARPYHQDAAQAFVANPRFLLADDLGTGKARSVSLALAVLVSQREIHRALIVAPRERLGYWIDELESFVPELARRQVGGTAAERRTLWREWSQIDLVAARDLAHDVEAGVELPGFDLMVVDSFVALLRRQAVELRQISKIEAARRWALAGAVPVDPEDWRALLGFLSPDAASGPARAGTGELRERFTQNTLRRSKTELARQMPRLARQEVWVDLDPTLARLYAQALAGERQRLARLGAAMSRSHLQASLDRLKQVCNFTPESYDGPKVRALIDLAEEITSGRSKLVVFTTFGEVTASQLQPALEAFGVIRLAGEMSQGDQAAALARFRAEPSRRVLLADVDARGDGESLDPATYVVHFDHDWNPAQRRRLEQRFFPDLGPALPLTVFELWVRGTIEEQYHRALEARHLLASHLPQDTQPADLEERLSLEDWRQEVFEATPPRPASPAAPPAKGTGALPGTGTLRARLESLSAGQLEAAVEATLGRLGFTTIQRLSDAVAGGPTFVACRGKRTDCRLVRILRTGRNIGVQEARDLLEEAAQRPESPGALLMATTEFTPACRKYAEDTGGRLSLMAGEDLYAHFRELGVVP
jgi:hypothetical protein